MSAYTTREISIEPIQAEAFGPIHNAWLQAQGVIQDWETALRLMGVDPGTVVGYSDGVLIVTEPSEGEGLK